MIKIWTVLVFLFAIVNLAGCSSNKGDAAGDELYIPEGYVEKLNALDLTEVAALPYFSSPFITVAEDKSGQQYAVLFENSGEVRQEMLPVKYEEIIEKLNNKGYSFEQPPNDRGFHNLHLFEINDKLYWSYADGESKVYLDLNGEEKNPFQK